MAHDSPPAGSYVDTTDNEIGVAGTADDGQKGVTRHLDDAEGLANNNRPNPRKEAPASVASLSPEERAAAERALVRKIDLRLLPMMVIMYIMNYLDREFSFVIFSLFLSLLCFFDLLLGPLINVVGYGREQYCGC